MPYILNNSNGSSFRHPDIGIVPPKTAVEVDAKIASKLKDNLNVVVFKNIIKKKKKTEEKRKFEDFLIDADGDSKKATEMFEESKTLSEGQ